MSIGNESYRVLPHVLVGTGDVATSTGDAPVVFDIAEPCTVTRIAVLVAVATSSAGAAVVAFDKRVLADSDTGRGTADVGTITVPVSTAAGTLVYKDVQVDCNAGQQIVPEITTTSAAGSFRYFVEVLRRAETAANQSKMLASA